MTSSVSLADLLALTRQLVCTTLIGESTALELGSAAWCAAKTVYEAVAHPLTV